MPFVFTDRESLSDRSVLVSNTPLKTNAKFARFCKRTKSLNSLFDYCASLCCNQLPAERKLVRWLFQRFHREVKCCIIFKSFFSNMIVIAIFKVSRIELSLGNVFQCGRRAVASMRRNEALPSVEIACFLFLCLFVLCLCIK